MRVALEVLDTFLEGIEFPKLEEEEAGRCEGLVTTEEVGQAFLTYTQRQGIIILHKEKISLETD